MTNEQRKAIEICKEKIIEPFYDFPNPTSIELKDTDVEAIDTVLSLIKEQQEEIGSLQKELNEENKRSMILANNDKFKEQVIDLMAEKLVQAHEWFYSEFDNFTKEDFIRYYENKVKGEG